MDYSNPKIVVSLQLTVEDKKLLDAANARTGLGKGHIASLAIRDWVASQEGKVPLPLGGYEPHKTIPGDVKEPMLIRVVPRDQFKSDGQ